MTKTFEFNEILKSFEKIQQQLEFDSDKQQVYFELQKGNPKVAISFLDDDDKVVLRKSVPKSAFLKPYTNKAKLDIMNTSESEEEVKFKIVTGIRIL